MSEEKSEVGQIAQAVSEVVKAVPVYQDAIQPGAKEVGKALETVGRTVNAALMPLRGMVWGMEQLEQFVKQRVGAKLKDTPLEAIQTPKANVAAPAFDAVRMAGDDPDLQEMYANLIATAMDRRVALRVFPSFVEILKQLTSDEAKILRLIGSQNPVSLPIVHLRLQHLHVQHGRTVVNNLSHVGFDAGCEYPRLVTSYIDNLIRLGLLNPFSEHRAYAGQGIYDRLESDPELLKLKSEFEQADPEYEGRFVRSGLEVTSLGSDFIRACVVPYETRSRGDHSSDVPSEVSC